jgi:conjugal transfer pilin signal peptidase TrbI
MEFTMPPRLSVPEYLRLVRDHFLRNWRAYTLPLVGIFVLQLFIRIDVNLTDSLPDKAFLTVKGWTSGIKKGDYVVFEYRGTGPASPFPYGFHFVKIVAGTEGDLITRDGENNFYRDEGRGVVGAAHLGKAKSVSKTGKDLQPGSTGVIPAGHYYMMAPNKDSLDSRYALVGFVDQTQLIGKTFALF